MTTAPINRMFRAFTDETRMRILSVLVHSKELCVCDIMRVLNLPQSKVSRHLAYLREAGLVRHRKAGLWSYYSVAEPASRFHRRLIGCLDGCFDEVPAMRKDRARLGRLSVPAERCR